MTYRIVIAFFLTAILFPCAYAKKKAHNGYPLRTDVPLEEQFRTPPPGYGEVPFYWWVGDTLTRERLLWQLDELAKKKISSLQVNYCHRDSGGLIYGLTYPSQPPLFSEQWWDLFGWFMEEASSRGMTVSLSDYTLGPGQGSYVDEMLADNPHINGYELHRQTYRLAPGETFSKKYHDTPLSLTLYEGNGSKPVSLLDKLMADSIYLSIQDSCEIAEITAIRKVPSVDPMNPDAGKTYVKYFFQRFEDRFPGKAQSGFNFFFSDELNFALGGHIWNPDFPKEFKKAKGYDIMPVLEALYTDIGEITPKVRLDYNDVMVSLSERNFFIPLFQWHQQRGLLFGCDHGGRGRQVDEFGDYFRTQRWNQAPGCDQPFLQKDVIKNKVASSIAHMYGRERVWLEGFHSSGWGTNSAQLADAIFGNFVMGQNLLSLHGLYYTTKGGRWEWAPPCNHFHEPYWEDMAPLLECTERLSYILSQGYHVADAAILYPVEPVVAGYGNTAVDIAFEAGERLYNAGIDFDFMDYESLGRASVNGTELHVANERFKVLIIPAMQAIKHSSLKKIAAFAKKGGHIIAVGQLPESTDLCGRNGKEMKELLEDIFQKGRPNVTQLQSCEGIKEAVENIIPRDFCIVSPEDNKISPYVMHRRIDHRHLYAIYNVPEGTICRFRAVGNASLWDPFTGGKSILETRNSADGFTELDIPGTASDIRLIVFDSTLPEQKATAKDTGIKKAATSIPLDSLWSFETIPSLDNTFGDWYLPAAPVKVGPMIHRAAYIQTDTNGNTTRECDATFGYGTRFMLLRLPEPDDHAVIASEGGNVHTSDSIYTWEPYDFSWRYGVENDCGHQGWHGLKGEISDDFIRLGDLERVFNGTQRRPAADSCNNYYLSTIIKADKEGKYDVEWGSMQPQSLYVNGIRQEITDHIYLAGGSNSIIMHFPKEGTARFVVRDGAPCMTLQSAAEAPLATSFRGDMSVLGLDTRVMPSTTAQFSFTGAPGMKAMRITAYSQPSVTVGGERWSVTETERRQDGSSIYLAASHTPVPLPLPVTITLPEPFGFQGGAVIDGTVELECGTGLIPIGDWSANDALSTYSGGARYSTGFSLSAKDTGNKIILDLGNVVASARLAVNGRVVATRVAPPWTFDITDYVTEGENRLEVTVHNTAANFFTTVPTTYRGSTASGILGPVELRMETSR